VDSIRERFAGDEEVCQQCFLSYEIGWHEVDEDGYFPSGGHYFVEADEEE
jgi:hypothetical protein